MTLPDFIRQHRMLIDVTAEAAGASTPADDLERQEWVLVDDFLQRKAFDLDVEFNLTETHHEQV